MIKITSLRASDGGGAYRVDVKRDHHSDKFSGLKFGDNYDVE